MFLGHGLIINKWIWPPLPLQLRTEEYFSQTCQVSRCHQESAGFNKFLFRFVEIFLRNWQPPLLKQYLIWKLFDPLSKTYSFNILNYFHYGKYSNDILEPEILNRRISRYLNRKEFSCFSCYILSNKYYFKFCDLTSHATPHIFQGFYKEFQLYLSILLLLNFSNTFFGALQNGDQLWQGRQVKLRVTTNDNE